MGEKSYRICPKCKLSCPKSQKVCDCGYVFGENEEGLTEKQFKKEQTKTWTLVCLCIFVGILGAVSWEARLFRTDGLISLVVVDVSIAAITWAQYRHSSRKRDEKSDAAALDSIVKAEEGKKDPPAPFDTVTHR